MKKNAKKLQNLTDPAEINEALKYVDMMTEAQAEDISGKALRRAISHILSNSRKELETKPVMQQGQEKKGQTGVKRPALPTISLDEEDKDDNSVKKAIIDEDTMNSGTSDSFEL